MNGRAIVMVHSGGSETKKAEIIEVLKYLGQGWYRIKCVFLDDPHRNVHVRKINIDGKEAMGISK